MPTETTPARRRGLSQRWKTALRAVMPLAPFSIDQLETASAIPRNELRAQLFNLCESGHLTRTSAGRYDLTKLGIEKIMD